VADRSHRVGHRRQRDRHAFQCVTFRLAVQRLMLSVLLEHDHRKKAGAGPPSRHDMERRWHLRDLLTVTARELLTHCLDHLPLAWLGFQGAGHVLAEFAQAASAAAITCRRAINHHAFARQMLREGVTVGTLAREPRYRGRSGDGGFRGQFVFRGFGLQLIEYKRQLIDQSHRAFGTLPIQLAFQLGDPQFLVGDQCHVLRGFGTRDGQFRGDFQSFRALADQRRFQRIDRARKTVVSPIHGMQRIIIRPICDTPKCIRSDISASQPALLGRHVSCGFLQSIPSSI
jgi:hypothetical protein